jgi:hypothetical protein
MTDRCECWKCAEDRALSALAAGDYGQYAREICVFRVCEHCGNKRCPHVQDHRLACTHSNDIEPGMIGRFIHA